MAKDFPGGTEGVSTTTGQYFYSSASPVTVPPITLFGWVRHDTGSLPTDNGNESAICGVTFAGAGSINRMYMRIDDSTTNRLQMVCSQNGVNSIFKGSNDIVADTWHFCCASFDTAGDFKLGFDSNSIETDDNTIRTPVNIDTFNIGGFRLPTNKDFDNINGQLAHVGMYNVILEDNEIFSLAAGFSPLLVRPQSLKVYCTLIPDGQPIDIMGNVGTWTTQGSGAFSEFDDYPLINPTAQILQFPPAAVGGVNAPTGTIYGPLFGPLAGPV